ncbi:hypothetical protein SL053_001539 [Flavobacterium psychrophilum]|uniref:Uncharacterized protein n=1 Tax=Flavobacterium psychrophilum (strain ATCC 49511 / DSM 21280 / CIP 103535 / JIP02/86) TaxID=402612 RepID=A6GXB1_FLAPJ|nr:hypothetical protein [Flavobacterium psychrophilum]AIJ38193.1 hypothetical protein FPSM_01698 [Flavobacterium psychrophilum]EKT3966693.1 hypothetical protein [Flavobacterium psychrophilum]EKT3974774.1 hypothetical protein [Flavobacterium psychrophilum]EKT4526831.1 hypothetical protein [Flavobacterium psychrophilum]EKT4537453.1 hypothetical protein [Flavobacterium psychrophilum]
MENNLITKQQIQFNKYSKNYIVSDKERFSLNKEELNKEKTPQLKVIKNGTDN